jgi:hypothetical protein
VRDAPKALFAAAKSGRKSGIRTQAPAKRVVPRKGGYGGDALRAMSEVGNGSERCIRAESMSR